VNGLLTWKLVILKVNFTCPKAVLFQNIFKVVPYFSKLAVVNNGQLLQIVDKRVFPCAALTKFGNIECERKLFLNLIYLPNGYFTFFCFH
jgi:hypothetical protein